MIRFAPFPIRHAPADDPPLNPAGRPTAIGVVCRRLPQVRRGAPACGGRVSTPFSLAALGGSVTFAESQVPDAIFLHPLAPRALPRFVATMGALTPPRPWLLPREEVWGGLRGLPALRIWPSELSVSNHLARPCHRFNTQPISVTDFRNARRTAWQPALVPVGVSPFPSRLSARPGRIEFATLRTARSPPVAPHPASRQRSYVRFQAGVCIPEEDSHLSDQTRLQAH